MISAVQLGMVDYATSVRLQQRLVEMRKERRIGDVLLLLEHPPVVTLGRNAKATNVLASPEQLAGQYVEVFECDRGGDVTFHGPGQLVGYPIVDLRGFTASRGARETLGAVEFVRRLEEVLIRTCADFGIKTERVPGLTGVWTSPCGVGALTGRDGSTHHSTSAEAAKIAAIGVHISRGVTSHGFALNVNTNLEYFKLIVPCGIASKPVTSLQRELGRQISLAEVAEVVARKFGQVFNVEILHVETLEALFGHSEGVPMKPPAELRELRNEEETFWA